MTAFPAVSTRQTVTIVPAGKEAKNIPSFPFYAYYVFLIFFPLLFGSLLHWHSKNNLCLQDSLPAYTGH